MAPEFFYLKVTSFDCTVKCFVNGFPVYETSGEGEMSNQVPINVYLVKGKENRLDIWMKPLTGQGKVQASTYRYGNSDVVSTDDAQNDRDVFTVQSADGVKEQTFYFGNDIFDFSAILVDAPVIDEENELNAYAAQLLDIIGRKAVKELVAEMEPKVRDYAVGFSSPEAPIRMSLEEQLATLLSDEKLDVPSIENVVLIPYCDRRVWALREKPDQPLIHISDNGSIMSLEIYVGTVDGRLRIVR